VSFGLAAVLFTRIRTGVREPDDPTGADNPTGDDPRRVRAGLIMAGLAAVAQGMFVVLFVPFVARALDGGAAETGLLRGVQAIGAIAGGLALGVLASRFRPGVLAVVGAAGFAVLDAVIWNAPQVTTARPLYIVLFAVIGAPGVVLITGLVTSLQRAVAPGRVGRVFGLFTAVSAGGQAVGMLAAGLLGDRVGVVAVLNVQAGLYLLAALVAAVGLVGPRTAPGTDGSPVAVKDPRQGTTPVGGDGGRR
jgi:MFS family permease